MDHKKKIPRYSRSIEFLRFSMNILDYFKPKKTDFWSRFHYVRYGATTICCVLFLICNLLSLFMPDITIYELTEATFTVLLGCHIFYKHFFSIQGYKLERLFDKMTRIYSLISAEYDEEGMLEEMDKPVYLLGVLAWRVIMWTYIPSYLIGNILKSYLYGKVILPLNFWTPPNFNVVGKFIFQIGITLPPNFVQANFLASTVIFTMHLANYIKILRKFLTKSSTKDSQRKFIKLHSEILEYSNLLNANLSDMILADSLSNSFELCFGSFILKKAFESGEYSSLPQYVMLIVLTLVLINTLSTLGQNITDQSDLLRQEIYNVNWYEKKATERRLTYFALLISTKPISLNYRGLIHFNMERCGNAIGGAFSYLTFMNSME